MTFHFALLPPDQAQQILPFAKQLNPDVDVKELEMRLQQILDYGDKVVGVFSNTQLIGCAVIRISMRFCYGRYCDVDNVIIDEAYRVQGLGTQLFDWIHAYAKEQGCHATVLDSYVTNQASHAFYEKLGYQNTCLHFFRPSS